MDNFQIMPRLDDGDNKGIPDGALTVLVIAAVAVVSVAVTLLCMLISHRRTLRRRQQSASAVAAAVAVNRPTSMPTSSPLPLYIQQAFDPKFDSPPTYEEAVRSPPLSPVATSPVTLASPIPRSSSPTPQLHLAPNSRPPMQTMQNSRTEVSSDVNRPSTSSGIQIEL
ncbi:hypothetical protein WR25_06256 [Diploscapter pachys]|uniref:Uncharacterized protein n=1 Tax=Diploscapter pachys TaxID=2018661 RepID=A0A2A2LXB8_9BILA|nr:hypothetical protein WR25_06256 [Diploscapter pachys]